MTDADTSTRVPDRPRIGMVVWALKWGGLERSMLKMARAFAQIGCDVEFVTTEESHGEWTDRARHAGYPVLHVPPHPMGALFHIRRTGRYLTERHYAVVFLFHDRMSQAAIGLLPDDMAVVSAIRNDDEVFYRLAAVNADAWNVLFTNSERLRQTAIARVPGRPVVSIPNGAEVPDATRFARRRDHGKPLEIVYLGRLDELKGILSLPDILQILQQHGVGFRLRIVGDGPLRSELLDRLRAAGLANRVRHLGFLDPAKVYEHLLDSHALILPSRVEGFPNAVLEAQVCGCVPVVSRLQGITDIAAEHEKTGFLVQCDDIAGYAAALERLAADPPLWTRMSAAGRELVSSRFSLERAVADYQSFLRDLLSGRYAQHAPRRFSPIAFASEFRWTEFLPVALRAAASSFLRPFRRRSRQKDASS